MRPALDRSPPPRALAPLVFCLLALATVGAFAYTQNLKREPLILDRVALGQKAGGPSSKLLTAFTPNGDCVFDNGRIRFRITKSDRADIQIVDPEERVIRTLGRDRFLKRYTFFTLYWDGRNGRGEVVPPGRYKLRLLLLSDDRSLVPGGALRLHDVAPRPSGCERGGGVAPGAGSGKAPAGVGAQ